MDSYVTYCFKMNGHTAGFAEESVCTLIISQVISSCYKPNHIKNTYGTETSLYFVSSFAGL